MKPVPVVLSWLAIAALAGFMLPAPLPPGLMPLVWVFGPVVTTALALFSWAVVRLVEPAAGAYSTSRARARLVVTSLTWVLLVALVGAWFRHIRRDADPLYYRLIQMSTKAEPIRLQATARWHVSSIEEAAPEPGCCATRLLGIGSHAAV